MKFLLFPLSLIYGFVIRIRNFLFDYDILSAREYDIPIVSVGNITVGGTGKTPHVEYLIENFKDKLKIAVLSRGYKRKTRGFLVVKENMTVQDAGDEPLQIKRKFSEITVAVCEKRVKGIDTLLSDKVEEKFDMILLDDAFQHRYVKPGLSVLLVDYNRLISKDHLLPYGRLREPAHQKKRADIILITKCPEEIKPIERRIMFKECQTFPYQNLYFTTFSYGSLISVFKDEVLDTAILQEKNYSILLVTGIANPKSLLEFLTQSNHTINHMKFSDHHNYSKKDMLKIKEEYHKMPKGNKLVLTTEKDAVRLIHNTKTDALAELPVYYISINVRVLNDDSENFLNDVRQYVYSNKRAKS